MEGGVVDSTTKQFRTGKITVLILAFVAALAIVLPAGNTAHAAENGSAQLGAGTVETSYLYGTGYSSKITAVPTNKTSYYETYSTYMFVNAGPNACAGCNLYLQYKQYGVKKWKNYGPLYSYNDYTVSGLRPNTWYFVRMVYASIYTSAVGKPSKTVLVKTGPKAYVPLKSVSVKALNVKKIKTHHVSPYDGYVYRTIYDIYYTYRIRVIVKLKKVPKANAIWVNGYKFKCNRKTYQYTTKKLVRYYNTPRGKTYSVGVCSYLSNNFGGYSLLYKRNYKIR